MQIYANSWSFVAISTIGALWSPNSLRKKTAYRLLSRRFGAKEPPKYSHADLLLGIDMFLEYKNALKEGRFLATTTHHFNTYSNTFKANQFGTTIIKSRGPQVLKAFHATQLVKFGLQPLRYENSIDLFGNSIIMFGDPAWAHARALITPSFETVHITNFVRLGKHVDRFMELLPKDGSTVDLFPLLKLLVLAAIQVT